MKREREREREREEEGAFNYLYVTMQKLLISYIKYLIRVI